MSTGVVVLLAVVVLALGFGAWRAMTDGRFASGRRTDRESSSERTGRWWSRERSERVETGTQTPPAALVVWDTGAVLGERATLLQFSSAFCAPCRATRRVLADVAGLVDGVAHVEVDAEQHLGATRELGVLRTPTTLVLDAEGREVARAAGAPTRDQVLVALGRAVP